MSFGGALERFDFTSGDRVEVERRGWHMQLVCAMMHVMGDKKEVFDEFVSPAIPHGVGFIGGGDKEGPMTVCWAVHRNRQSLMPDPSILGFAKKALYLFGFARQAVPIKRNRRSGAYIDDRVDEDIVLLFIMRGPLRSISGRDIGSVRL